MARLHTLTAAALLLLLALAGGTSAARQLKADCEAYLDLTGTSGEASSSVSTQTVYQVQQGVGSAAAACRGDPNGPGCKQMVEAVAQTIATAVADAEVKFNVQSTSSGCRVSGCGTVRATAKAYAQVMANAVVNACGGNTAGNLSTSDSDFDQAVASSKGCLNFSGVGGVTDYSVKDTKTAVAEASTRALIRAFSYC